MFKQIITGSIVGISLIFAGPAMAHNSHGHHHHNYQTIQPIVKPAPRRVRHCVAGKKVDNLQAQLKRSIRKGIRKGKLVGWEIPQARKQMRRINKTEKKMRHSGHCLTKKEAKQLVKKLNRATTKVRNLKRNNVRWGHSRRHHRHNQRRH